jgi:hypothetical protein
MNPEEYIKNATNTFAKTSLAYDRAIKVINFKER